MLLLEILYSLQQFLSRSDTEPPKASSLFTLEENDLFGFEDDVSAISCVDLCVRMVVTVELVVLRTFRILRTQSLNQGHRHTKGPILLLC